MSKMPTDVQERKEMGGKRDDPSAEEEVWGNCWGRKAMHWPLKGQAEPPAWIELNVLNV